MVGRGVESRYLNLAHLGLGDARIAALASCIATLPIVQHVNLENNRVTDISLAHFISELAKRESGLLTLNLASNNVGLQSGR